MLAKSPFDHDSRIQRAAGALATAGHEVTVVALPVGARPQRERWEPGYVVVRADPDADAGTAAPAAGPRPSEPDHGQGAASSRRIRRHPVLAPVRRAKWMVLNEARMRAIERRMLEAGRQAVPDVVHAHDADTLHLGHRLAREFGAALVYDAHELATEERESRSRVGTWRIAVRERRLVRRADAVITVCDSIARVLSDRHRPSREIRVVRNVPERVDRPAVELRQHVDLPDGCRIVLFLGGISAERGLDSVVAAVGRAPGLCLLLVGQHDPEYLGRLRSMAADGGFAERLVVAPAVPPEQVTSWAAGADVGVVLPRNVSLNHWYSLPNKFFEYIVAGLPVVASNFPELQAHVEALGVGLTVDPDDVDGLAEALQTVATQSRFREAAAAAAGDLNWQKEQHVLLGLYAELEQDGVARSSTGVG